jgi:quercetin dioxygenase-like cupin family protein
MTYRIARAAEREWADSATVPGLRDAILIDGRGGASHLEVRLFELRADAAVPAHRHPFEESWYVLSGKGQRTVAGLAYEVATGDYGFSPGGGRPRGCRHGREPLVAVGAGTQAPRLRGRMQ